jgi:hypothetical protein
MAMNALNLGTLNIGSCTVTTGGPLSTASTLARASWYTLTVQAPESQSGVVANASANPRIYLSGDMVNYYVFDVYTSPGANQLAMSCDGGGFTATGRPFFYGTNYPAQKVGFCTLPRSPQSLWVKVYPNPSRTNSSCEPYTLNVSD